MSPSPDSEKRFSWSSTAREVVGDRDLSGKVVLVTGGNCGIGYETAKALAFNGAKVVMACRTLEKANAAVDTMKQENSQVDVAVMRLDLTSLRSVKNFAEQFKKEQSKLDVLICNAGIMMFPFGLTEDGFEVTFQTNYLAHVYLIQLLEDLLIASAPSRVVFVSSEAHRIGRARTHNISWDYLSPPTSKNWWRILAYGDSKLCMNLIARFMAKKYKEKQVSVFAVHPGAVYTELGRNLPLSSAFKFFSKRFVKTAEQGAATQVYCAIWPDIENTSGSYYNSCAPCAPTAASEDDELAVKLWKITQEMLDKKAPQNT